MSDPRPHMTPSYGSYLRLETLLQAQSPPDYAQLTPDDAPGKQTRALAHDDELLFIVVHQTFELWFRLILHELGRVRDRLGRRIDGVVAKDHVPEEDIPSATAGIQRVNKTMLVATQGFEVMETMSPTSFLEFRDLLIPSSGFQSVQFRELEILAGLAEDLRMDFEGVPYATKLTPEDRTVLEKRRSEQTLKAALFDWLSRTPIEELYDSFAEDYIAAFEAYLDEQVQHQLENPNLADSQKEAAKRRFEAQAEAVRRYLLGGDEATNRAHQSFLFIASYRRHALLRWPSALLDQLIEFEQNFRIFRFRHARMVERMIGRRTGSGGSAGVNYLDGTTQSYQIFGDLLEARNFLLAGSRVPPLPDPDRVAFRFGA